MYIEFNLLLFVGWKTIKFKRRSTNVRNDIKKQSNFL